MATVKFDAARQEWDLALAGQLMPPVNVRAPVNGAPLSLAPLGLALSSENAENCFQDLGGVLIQLRSSADWVGAWFRAFLLFGWLLCRRRLVFHAHRKRWMLK